MPFDTCSQGARSLARRSRAENQVKVKLKPPRPAFAMERGGSVPGKIGGDAAMIFPRLGLPAAAKNPASLVFPRFRRDVVFLKNP